VAVAVGRGQAEEDGAPGEMPPRVPARRPDSALLMEIFHRLLTRFGRQHWWPEDSPLEVVVGAILTQNTAWPNVEKALSALKAPGEFSVKTLSRMSLERLSQRIRPSGSFRVKARRLKKPHGGHGPRLRWDDPGACGG
jgi:endonuclease-3 related protein